MNDIIDSNVNSENASNELLSLGLRDEDAKSVQSMLDSFRNSRSIDEIGKDLNDKLLHKEESTLLQRSLSSDAEEAGAKLLEILRATQDINANDLNSPFRKIPVVGKLIGSVDGKIRKFRAKYESIESQVTSLVNEVSKTVSGLQLAKEECARSIENSKKDIRTLGIYIAAGKEYMAEMRKKYDSVSERLKESPSNPVLLEEMDRLEYEMQQMDIRISYWLSSQQAYIEMIPQYRIEHKANDLVIEKFKMITDITLPTWRRIIGARLSLKSQSKAISIAEAIDQTTNQLLIENAQLMRRNAVSAAKSVQSTSINIKTLEAVYRESIATVEDVSRITQQGIRDRQMQNKQIMDMRAKYESMLRDTSEKNVSVLPHYVDAKDLPLQ